ncbi:Sodium/calcium exchanger protein-domain-containing protein [Pisolithus orientalis]|uniref:Sodium/calcium exchanger protein-domain-containing protein n=1 Tax=Pisolithus orientalis TaxID=936130 RepID=UPI002224525C|nr:Sodium/calcium exchanger protein-domain-containing protein [Pisolithus orientalis]KAI6008134.1 Sodium/calcium exchanger protein-domain-containing protein [Pisolithus orientalis]
MSSRTATAILFVCLFAQCILLSRRSRHARVPQEMEYQLASALSRQLQQVQCHPLDFGAHAAQCHHVQQECPISDTVLSFPYLQTYFCSDPSVRPLVFTALLLWLFFLFSTLGISASDFFTPNLATIAQFLGLDENVAGVTFLAFGNASPDVFSTFSAMRADSGSLAIGELLGAASFIVSCVVGSMCIIRPFKVDPLPFLRDVGFFTIAVIMLLVILRDGLIQAWESAMLVLWYICYAFVVVVGSWIERRMERVRRREDVVEPITQPYTDEEPYSDEPPPPATVSADTLAVPVASSPKPTISGQHPPRIAIQTQLPSRPKSRSPSPIHTPPHLAHMPSFSLVGALEFRQVVESLRTHAASSSLDVFDAPLTPYAGGHYHQHHHRPRGHSESRSPSRAGPEINPWDAELGVPLNDRSPRLLRSSIAEDRDREESERPSALDEGIQLLPTPLSGPEAIPSISRTPASPVDSDASTDVERYVPPTKGERLRHVLARTCHILFPSLHHFWSKSLLRKIVALLAAPAVMALTLTLPVVVIPYGNDGTHEEKPSHHRHPHHHHDTETESRLVEFEEEGVERTLMAEEVIQEDFHEMEFNKWLMAAQCVFGPLFCVAVLFSRTDHLLWLLGGTAVGGVAAGLLVLIFANDGFHPTARMARCSMGFFVAIVWIMAIADEVVNVLQTFGFIFGLSDAIIGLTIFAVGNSLADLVANMSVAVFAPIMGFSACFGGPLVNILLGVGISGSYIISQTPNAHPYRLHFTPSLMSSAFGLLGLLLITLVGVPLNGYHLTRKWGVFLVVAYVVLMVVNILVEVKY